MALMEDIKPYSFEKLSVYGFLRDVLPEQKDYDDIVLIIILYHRQGFAKYYDAKVDKDYKHRMRFGDILKTKKNKYKVLGLNNNMIAIKANHTSWNGNIHLDVPLSICENLTDAISFYSKLNTNGIAFVW